MCLPHNLSPNRTGKPSANCALTLWQLLLALVIKPVKLGKRSQLIWREAGNKASIVWMILVIKPPANQLRRNVNVWHVLLVIQLLLLGCQQTK